MPPVLQQPSEGVLKGQSKPCHTRPLSSPPTQNARTTPPPAPQGASGNLIPAISPFAPQAPSALSQTAPPINLAPPDASRPYSPHADSQHHSSQAGIHRLGSCPAPWLGLAPGVPTDLRVILSVQDCATSSAGYLDGAEGGPPDSGPASKPTSGQSKLCFHPPRL